MHEISEVDHGADDAMSVSGAVTSGAFLQMRSMDAPLTCLPRFWADEIGGTLAPPKTTKRMAHRRPTIANHDKRRGRTLTTAEMLCHNSNNCI